MGTDSAVGAAHRGPTPLLLSAGSVAQWRPEGLARGEPVPARGGADPRLSSSCGSLMLLVSKLY